jgi:hypothetical protein
MSAALNQMKPFSSSSSQIECFSTLLVDKMILVIRHSSHMTGYQPSWRTNTRTTSCRNQGNRASRANIERSILICCLQEITWLLQQENLNEIHCYDEHQYHMLLKSYSNEFLDLPTNTNLWPFLVLFLICLTSTIFFSRSSYMWLDWWMIRTQTTPMTSCLYIMTIEFNSDHSLKFTREHFQDNMLCICHTSKLFMR